MTAQAGNPTTILLVEDQEETAMLISFYMENWGYAFRHAANGQQALEMLQEGFAPSLILLDIMMPVMDGYQFLERLQEDEALQQIPVVMLTGLDEARDVLKAVKRGAIDYCTKPIEPDDLQATIQRLLNSSR